MRKLGLGLGLSAQLKGGGSSSGPVDLPVTPTARWHPEFSSVTTSSGRVTGATDLQGLANASDDSSGDGPLANTDGLGRAYWRFQGSEWLAVADSLVTDTRDVTAFAVARVHRTATRGVIFSQGRNGVVGNTGGGVLETRVFSNSAPYLAGMGRLGYQGTSSPENLIPGTQLQVIGVSANASRLRYALNNNSDSGTAGSINTTGILGAEIGRYAFSGGSDALIDIYEIMVFDSALSDADVTAVSDALQAGWGISNVTSQLILEGDSITQGTGSVTSGFSSGVVVTNPGASLVPSHYRVVNLGVSGNEVSDLLNRRDSSTSSWCDQTLSGENVVAFEIGRNDMYGGGLTPATHYSNVVGYLNTTTTGVLQRGWSVRQMVNIATSDTTSGTGGNIGAYRTLILDTATYFNDLDAGSGQTFDGKVSLVSTYLIEDGGSTVFFDSTDAADNTYYDGDSTHPNVAGAALRVNGGDNPSQGVASGLT